MHVDRDIPQSSASVPYDVITIGSPSAFVLRECTLLANVYSIVFCVLDATHASRTSLIVFCAVYVLMLLFMGFLVLLYCIIELF